MDDIVERLYDLRERFIFQGGSEFARKLADELMALRTKAASWEKVFGHLGTADECGNEWIRLQDENESLRESLEEWKLDFNNLKADNDEQCRLLGMSGSREARLLAQLAAAQVREAQLREAFNLAMEVLYDIDTNNEVPDYGSGHLYVSRHDGPKIVKAKELANALADLPHDDTALKAALKEERERVAKHFEKLAQDYASEYGYDDMGSLSFGRGVGGEIKMDYYNGLLEMVDTIRNLGDE